MFLLTHHPLLASAERRAARRSRVQRQRRSPARVGAVTWQCGRSDVDTRSGITVLLAMCVSPVRAGRLHNDGGGRLRAAAERDARQLLLPRQ